LREVCCAIAAVLDRLRIQSSIRGRESQVLPFVQEVGFAYTLADRPQKRADTLPYLSVAETDGSCCTTLYSWRPNGYVVSS